MVIRAWMACVMWLLFQPTVDTGRTHIFISDLHFGVGRTKTGWSAYEDFRWGQEFEAFLASQSSRGDVDLILVGDTFELWQSTKEDCRYANANLGCTEAEARGRLDHVIAEHRSTLNAVGQFARQRNNRVIIIPGNHDAGLLFPSVRAALVAALGAPSDRLQVLDKGYWLSVDGLLYAEHGHQIGKEVNRFARWPRPFIQADNREHLERSWGEKFVQDFYNQYEEKYQIIDNISQESTGVRYGVKAEGGLAAARAARELIEFFIFDISLKQFGDVLDDQGPEPRWNIEAVRAMGSRAISDSLAYDSALRVAAEQAMKNGELPLQVSRMSDEEIRLMCDGRMAMRAGQRKRDEPLTVPECPRMLGAAGQNLLRRPLVVMRDHLGVVYRALVKEGVVTRPFSVVVWGHTHAAMAPRMLPQDPLGTTVVNTGAWQRVIDPERLHRLATDRSLTEGDVLRSVTLEDLPACYSFVEVQPYATKPVPRLKFWSKQQDGSWATAEQCR